MACQCKCSSHNDANGPKNTLNTPSSQLVKLGIELPAVAAPVAAYVPAKRQGCKLQTSGQLPTVGGRLAATGKLGAEISTAEGAELARLAAINALAALASVAGSGSEEALAVDLITEITHVTVFVASTADFAEQALVANGASLLFQEVFGDAGVHTRSAVGVACLPLNSPVEVEVQARVGRKHHHDD